MNRQRATAAIVNNGKVLLIRRMKGGRQYFVFPGGGVEADESPEAALFREIKEELELDIQEYELLADIADVPVIQPGTEEYLTDIHLYLVSSYGGEPTIIEREKISADNQYHLEWIPIVALKDLQNIYPDKVSRIVLERLS